MTQTHNYSFFGQKTGMILQSSSTTDPFVFFKFLKRTSNGDWEKLSKGQGKSIKFSLEEVVLILQIVNHTIPSWSTVHKFKGTSTSISFEWHQESEKNSGKTLWVKMGQYSKMLNTAQCEILRLLLAHILQEKIEFATGSEMSTIANLRDTPQEKESEIYVQGEVFMDGNSPQKGSIAKDKEQEGTLQYDTNHNTGNITINGEIKGETEKALFIAVGRGRDIWFPKSTIHSEFSPEKDKNQSFAIDKWIIEKHKLSA